MDELKKYFREHRGELDTDIPRDKNWDKIRRELHPAAPVKSLPLFKWAVAACLVILTGTAVYWVIRDTRKTDTVISSADTSRRQDTPVVIKDPLIEQTPEKKEFVISKPVIVKRQSVKPKISTHVRKRSNPVQTPKADYGFETLEASYSSMVNQQLERVRTQPIYAEKPEYFDLFKQQFANLNGDEEQIKKNIRQTGMMPEYLDELINIYQQKLSILKQLQFEIKKMNTRARQTAPGALQQPSYINL
jgi:hypothetical protein